MWGVERARWVVLPSSGRLWNQPVTIPDEGYFAVFWILLLSRFPVETFQDVVPENQIREN